jgi:lysophospholipase L1-like esterase
MFLNFEQVVEAATGADLVVEKDSGFRFNRIHANLDFLYRKPLPKAVRKNCPSCVRLRFKSNTDFIKINLKYYQFARAFFKCTIFVDGEFLQAFGADNECPEWSGEIFTNKNGAEHSFDIWLPHCVDCEVGSLELSDGSSFVEADSFEKKWLAYGDSITQGMSAFLPSDTWVGISARKLNVEIRNLGIGGAVARQELSEHLPDYRYDFASIAYGVNDFNQGVDLDAYEDNMYCLVEELIKFCPDKPIFVLSPIHWVGRDTPNGNGATLDDFRQKAECVAGKFDVCRFIDGKALVPDDADYYADNIHPNDKGMKSFAENFVAQVKDFI